MMATILAVVIPSSFTMSLRTRCVMVQNKNRMHAALISALMMLTMRATVAGLSAKREKKLPVSMKNGAPGGCPTSSL